MRGFLQYVNYIANMMGYKQLLLFHLHFQNRGSKPNPTALRTNHQVTGLGKTSIA